ncbi:hypothetical protein VNI00_009549 [Paramarasmius palmivorus]|uniref:Uncharacterized protein n=1 Tax=Paramarasmius palmivorus TaxID=297713 RepID=A0AAW0CQD6_9AGAR
MFSRGTSRPNKDLEESSPETLSLADDHPEAQAGPSTGAPKATKGRYYLRHRETRSFAVSNDTNAISPVTGLRPLTSRKRKRVGDTDNASRKKSPQVEYRQNERKRRHPSEPDSGRPNKRRRRPW